MKTESTADTGTLAMQDLEQSYQKLRMMAPDRLEMRFCAMTAMGCYSQQFLRIEEANAPIMGGLLRPIPMIEDDLIPEGIIILRNLENFPKGPAIQIIDLRPPVLSKAAAMTICQNCGHAPHEDVTCPVDPHEDTGLPCDCAESVEVDSREE